MAFTRPASSNQQLTYGQVEQLWINAGGSASLAPLMAAIAKAESGLNPTSLNDTPSTGDYSVGLWQINYYNGMLASRTRQFGSPQDLLADPAKQAAAAVAIYREQGLGAWSTYSSGAYRQYLNGSVPPDANVPTATNASATQASSGSGDCQISVLGVCLITKQQTKQLLGIITIGAGGFVGLVGVLILVGYGLARTGAVEKAAAIVPTPVGKAISKSRSTSRARSAATERQAAAGRRRAAREQERAAKKAQTPLNAPIRSGSAKKAAPKEQRRRTEDTGVYEGGE